MRHLGPVLEFMRALWALDHALQSASKRMEARVGVTAPQRLVVRIVGRFPGISAGEVAEILHVHPSTLTGVLKRLEARKVILRRVDPGDARRAPPRPHRARPRLDALRSGTIEAVVRQVLRDLPPEAVRSARTLAEALTAALAQPAE